MRYHPQEEGRRKEKHCPSPSSTLREGKNRKGGFKGGENGLLDPASWSVDRNRKGAREEKSYVIAKVKPLKKN